MSTRKPQNLSDIAQAKSFEVANEHGEMIYQGNWQGFLKDFYNKHGNHSYTKFKNDYWRVPGEPHNIYIMATKWIVKMQHRILIFN